MFFIVIPVKNSKLKTLTFEEFHAQNPLPLKNSRDPRRGGGGRGMDIKWNSPINVCLPATAGLIHVNYFV